MFKEKGGHGSSTDSSLLEVAANPKPNPPDRYVPEHAMTNQLADSSMYPQKRRKIRLLDEGEPDCSSASSISCQKAFEKRARRKTREDRYEPKEKKSRRSGKIEAAKRIKARRERQGDKKAAVKRKGDGLMNGFSSKSIGRERLTVSSFPSTVSYKAKML